MRQRMSDTLALLSRERFTPFTQLFTPEEGRDGVVVSFLAILELLKAGLVEIVQAEPYAPIHLRAGGGGTADAPEDDDDE
ncbi:Segregation and condensation protein A [wastewater metagenome]|uniref:Segregation and condensation protein A n=2 Tax=unclassified sequences TaxID=12908 RepID=A0A5B8REX1_9ZZZZ|nr:segregation and condensation protein A [uncultured organism]